MTSYTNVEVRIWKGQKDKLKKAFESNCEFIAIYLTSSDLNGEGVIAITKSQLGRLMKAYEANKGITIKMSRRQLAYNRKIVEGFLPMRAGLIPFPTGTVFACIRSWGFIRTGKYRCSKTNRKWVVS